MTFVLVLGATGSCGRHFVDHALDADYRVRCLVRKPSQLTVDRYAWAGRAGFECCAGDLLDPAVVDAACADVDAVVCMVGPPPGATESPLGRSLRYVVAGMRRHGVRRLLVQTGAFTKIDGEPSAMERAVRAAFVMATNEGAVLAGNDEAARFLATECSDIDWTITRPGMLDDRPPCGVVEADDDDKAGEARGKIGKSDLTRWYVNLLGDERSVHKAPKPRYADSDFGFAQERVDGQKRVALITGANAGLGYETARMLLNRGMRVILACRNLDKGTNAARALLAATPTRPGAQDDDVRLENLDVASLASVRAFANRIRSTRLPLHVLLCNAGIMMGPQRVSVDGIELQLATNYLGHFELCRLLQDRLAASAPARVIHVSSIAARMASIDPQQLNRTGDHYSSRSVYGMTKLAQIVFSRTLDARMRGTGVTSNSLEPGIVSTNLSQGITDDPAMRARLEKGVPVEVGARTHVFLSASMRVNGVGGGHWVDCHDVSRGFAKLRFLASAPSLHTSMNDALWAASERLIAKAAP